MPISLKCKLKKLNHNGSITDEEYEDLLKKLDGHDKQIRADAIEEIIPKVIDLLIDADVVSEKNRITDTNWLREQLKEEK